MEGGLLQRWLNSFRDDKGFFQGGKKGRFLGRWRDTFEDDKGFFQGGKEGRFLGRIRDALFGGGDPSKESVAQQVDSRPRRDMYQPSPESSPDRAQAPKSPSELRLSIGDNLLNYLKSTDPVLSRSSKVQGDKSKSFLGLSKKELDALGKIDDTAKVWGAKGLIGQHLFDKYINSPEFNIDLADSQINWSPTDRLSLYARPDSLEDDIPRGIQIGGSYKF
jgi:hypothetical protein